MAALGYPECSEDFCLKNVYTYRDVLIFLQALNSSAFVAVRSAWAAFSFAPVPAKQQLRVLTWMPCERPKSGERQVAA